MDPSQILAQLLSGTGVSTSQLPSQVDFSLGNILRAVIILVVVYLLALIVRRVTARVLKRANLEPRVEALILRVAFYGIISLGVIWVLGGFGLSVVVLGIAVGFALKDLIENFAAGLLLMGTRPFHTGDWIQIGDTEGRVTEIGWRGTFIDTFDGRRVIMPNSMLVKNVVTNNSVNPQLRSTLNLGVALQNDFDKVEAIVLNALKGVEGIAAEPAPRVFVDSINSTMMNLIVWIWIPNAENRRRAVVSAAWRAIKNALVENAIQVNPPPLAPVAADVPPK